MQASFKSLAALSAAATAMLVLLPLTYSAETKRLAVYTPGSAIQLPIVEQAGTEYVILTGILDRVGPVTTSTEGSRTRINLNGIEAEFTAGSPTARIGSAVVQSGGMRIDDGRLLAPLDSLETILQHFADSVELHRAARRLFIGPVKQLASPELKRVESTLSVHFPAPVSPLISTDAGRLRMVFSREPVVMSSDRFDYADSVIRSVVFRESNGAAEIRVEGGSPLLATFADGGRRIDITVARAGPTTHPISASSSALAKPLAQPGFLVVIDAAHGGSEAGVRFSDKLVEKDLVLAVARKLRNELQNKAVTTFLLRDDDSAVPLDARALLANQRRASIYVSIHAGTLGTGVRIYSPLAATAADRQSSLFTPWESAQSASYGHSRRLASALLGALHAGKIKAESFTAALPPLDRIAAPAVALEIAPQTAGAAPDSLDSAKYQSAVAEAAVTGIIAARAKIEASR